MSKVRFGYNSKKSNYLNRRRISRIRTKQNSDVVNQILIEEQISINESLITDTNLNNNNIEQDYEIVTVIPGEKGERGIQGLIGDQGLKGDNGNQGEQGIPGLNGDKGESGEQGIPGIQGERGNVNLENFPVSIVGGTIGNNLNSENIFTELSLGLEYLYNNFEEDNYTIVIYPGNYIINETINLYNNLVLYFFPGVKITTTNNTLFNIENIKVNIQGKLDINAINSTIFKIGENSTCNIILNDINLDNSKLYEITNTESQTYINDVFNNIKMLNNSHVYEINTESLALNNTFETISGSGSLLNINLVDFKEDINSSVINISGKNIDIEGLSLANIKGLDLFATINIDIRYIEVDTLNNTDNLMNIETGNINLKSNRIVNYSNMNTINIENGNFEISVKKIITESLSIINLVNGEILGSVSILQNSGSIFNIHNGNCNLITSTIRKLNDEGYVVNVNDGKFKLKCGSIISDSKILNYSSSKTSYINIDEIISDNKILNIKSDGVLNFDCDTLECNNYVVDLQKGELKMKVKTLNYSNEYEAFLLRGPDNIKLNLNIEEAIGGNSLLTDFNSSNTKIITLNILRSISDNDNINIGEPYGLYTISGNFINRTINNNINIEDSSFPITAPSNPDPKFRIQFISNTTLEVLKSDIPAISMSHELDVFQNLGPVVTNSQVNKGIPLNSILMITTSINEI